MNDRRGVSVRQHIALVPVFSAVASVLLFGFAVGAYLTSIRTEHDQTAHLIPAADAADRLYVALLEQELAVLGFVLTRDDEFLEPYERGKVVEREQIDRLEAMLQPWYADIDALIEPLRRSALRWRAEVAEPQISSARSGRGDEAAATARAGPRLVAEMTMQLDALRAAIEDARTDSRNQLDRRFDRLFLATLLAAIGAIAAASITWLLARRRVAEPLERLAHEASSVASGRLDTRITSGGLAEIDKVARSVEQMRVQLLGEVNRAFTSGMVEAEEAERARLAGELHDDPIQVLTAAQWQLETLAAQLPQDDRASAATITAALADVQQRLRTLMFRLHPPGLDDEGLATALDDLLLDTFDDTAVEVRLAVDLPEPLASAASTMVFRITAEAIRNVRKHAGATSIDVSVRTTGDGVQLSIIDDGCGTATSVGPGAEALDGVRLHHHQGISISRALAAAAGGWWHQSSRPGIGTTVTCWLPVAFVDGPSIGRGDPTIRPYSLD